MLCSVCRKKLPWDHIAENGRCDYCNHRIAFEAARTRRANREKALVENGKARKARREGYAIPNPIEPAAGHLDPDCVLIPPTHPLRLPALPATPFDFIVCDLDMVEDQPWAWGEDGMVWSVVGVPVNLEGA